MDFDGRVVIVTGAGRGIGRGDALLLAELGARVVVNDLGGATDGSGGDHRPADEVVDEIRATGGTAVANHDDVADWDGARNLVQTAIDSFGVLHGLVNNVGVLRNRMIFNSTPDDWDPVVRVNLRGNFAPTRWAAKYWREQLKEGNDLLPAVVNTVSQAGIFGSPGGSNYAAAKGGAVTFTLTVARELAQYGIRVNAVGPAARTRLTTSTPSGGPPAAAPGEFDEFDPANIAPLVAYLVSADCPYSCGIFSVVGGRVGLYDGWEIACSDDKQRRWSLEELASELPAALAGRDFEQLSINQDDPTLGRQRRSNERLMTVLGSARDGGRS